MILIVDDKIENITALKKILVANNFEVDSALSGEEALRKILKNTYQLIILDVQMPEMDGFEVAEAITGINKTNDLPIIFLSAVNISKQFITKGYASGGHDYLVKPFDPDILILKIKTFSKLRQQALALSKTQRVLLDEIEQRKEAEAKKDEFIGIASHELKTPLTSIKGYIQLAELSIVEQDTETALKFIHQSSKQLNKLNALLAELLDISTMTSGKLNYNFSIFPFDNFIDNIIDTFSSSHEGWKIFKTGCTHSEVRGDAIRLEQVMLNYLSNAVKYSHNTNEIFLNISVRNDKDIKVEVTDKGIGIKPEDQPYIFEKFYRVKQSAYKYQGMGIGLYICAEIIRQHSGSYGVKSEPAKGSTFYFTIPIHTV